MGKTTTSKMRGSKSCGYGSKKKHRGKGSKGGRGMAGSKKHNKFKVLKENPNYFVHKKLKKKIQYKIINLKDLEKLGKDKINLKELGYTKLLGDGEIKKKFEIIIDKWSTQAEEKIKKSGGKITAPEEKTKKAGGKILSSEKTKKNK